jgi:transcription termination factor Rho
MDLDNQEPTSNEVAAPPRKRGSRRVVSTDAPVESAPAAETSAEGAAEAAPERPRRRRPQADEAAPARDESANDSSDEGSDNGDDSGDDQGNGFGRGRGRGRGRDRRRGRGSFGEDGEPEISDDDVLIPIGGILDVLDNYAFVRTQGYLPGATDVYVSLGQVKKYNLRKGDAVIGSIRQPRDGENQGRQKYNALVSVDSVNGQTIDEAANRVDFQALTAVRLTMSPVAPWTSSPQWARASAALLSVPRRPASR